MIVIHNSVTVFFAKDGPKLIEVEENKSNKNNNLATI
jgi:hypothetical protein